MTWYAASVIVSIRPILQNRGPITIYENVVLVEASSADEAKVKAKLHSAKEPDADNGLTIDDQPAKTTVEGIRKLVTVSNPWPLDQDKERPIEGTEITYSRFEMKDEEALQDLVAGKEVSVTYIE